MSGTNERDKDAERWADAVLGRVYRATRTLPPPKQKPPRTEFEQDSPDEDST